MLAVAIVVTSSLAGCGKETGRAMPSTYAAMYDGLCAARAQASNAAAARDLFFDRSHQPIHELATETARRDRAVAGRLLEAKQTVEHDLAAGGASLGADLDRLLAVSRGAIKAAGYRPPHECEADR